MKNYFLIHGSFGNSKEHYFPWLKQKIEEKCNLVFSIDFPIGKDKQTFISWSNNLDKYKSQINKKTIIIARSIAPIFILKYLQLNNLKINKLICVSGFNGFINIPDYDYVNKTFFMDNLDRARKLCKHIVCFYSKNDPYVPFYLLENFAKNLHAKKILIKDAGHFNEDSGYGEGFVDIIKYI